MKKLLTLILALGFTFAFVACENKPQTEEAETTEEVVEEAGEDMEEAAEEVEEGAEEAAEDVEESIEEGAEEVEEEVDTVENAG